MTSPSTFAKRPTMAALGTVLERQGVWGLGVAPRSLKVERSPNLVVKAMVNAKRRPS